MITMERVQNIGLSIPQFIIGIMFSGFGIMIYVVIPSAFIYQNLELFFFCTNLIVLLMVLGLSFLGVLLQPFIERLVTSIALFILKKDRPLKFIVMNNLMAHQKRNTKTAIIFSISLSYLIYCGSVLTLGGTLLQK